MGLSVVESRAGDVGADFDDGTSQFSLLDSPNLTDTGSIERCVAEEATDNELLVFPQ